MTSLNPSQRALIEHAAQSAPILVALSGGGDSMALLFLMIDQLGADRLRACIVDHALRQGSALDASLAAERARALGVQSEILTLSWPQGPRKSQAAARRARYRALCDAARRHGAPLIVLGHTADDQAETIMMRKENGSSWRGLAGMREIGPAPIWPEGRDIFIARPLMAFRRGALREFLLQRRAEWIEDPANSNVDFERVRMRARLAEMEASGFDPMQLCAEAREHRARASALDCDAYALIEQACSFLGGDVIVRRAHWRGCAEEARVRALSVLLAAVAGAEREAPFEAVARLDAQIAAPDFAGATLGGTVVRLWRRKAEIRISRDPGAVRGRADGAAGLSRLELPAGELRVWDNRLEVAAEAPSWSIAAGPDAAPLVENNEISLSCDQAETAGVIRARWLTFSHIRHLLPPESALFIRS